MQLLLSLAGCLPPSLWNRFLNFEGKHCMKMALFIGVVLYSCFARTVVLKQQLWGFHAYSPDTTSSLKATWPLLNYNKLLSDITNQHSNPIFSSLMISGSPTARLSCYNLKSWQSWFIWSSLWSLISFVDTVCSWVFDAFKLRIKIKNSRLIFDNWSKRVSNTWFPGEQSRWTWHVLKHSC